MLKKKLTLMVVPDSAGISRQLQLPVVLLYSSAVFFLLLLATSLYLASEFLNDRVARQQLESLRVENNQLMEKYGQIRESLAEANARFHDLVQKEIKIRTMFNLPEIDSEERQLGIGGPISPGLADISDAQRVAYGTEKEVDRLLRLAQFELENFTQVETELQGLRSRLDHTPSIWPAKGWKGRGFGMHTDPFTGYLKPHQGVDIANNIGTPVIATADGQVESAGKVGRMGNMIVIEHGHGLATRYGHLSRFSIRPGQTVKRGDVIGYIGDTGYTTGPHLHYEVWRNGRAVNPRDFILTTL